MPPIAPALAPDKFSWPRVGALLRLMWPRLRTTFFVYLAVGIFSCMLVVLLSTIGQRFFTSLLPLALLVAGLLFYIAPMFAVNSIAAQQLSLLPASTGEKFVALCIYGFIVLPVACYLFPQAASTWLIFHDKGVCENLPYLSHLIDDTLSWKYIISWFSALLPGSVCLYSAIKHPGTRWRPATMGVATVFAIGLIGGIIGAAAGLRLALQHSETHQMFDADETASIILSDSLPWLGALSVVSIILTVVALRSAYRTLATRQL